MILGIKILFLIINSARNRRQHRQANIEFVIW